MEFKGKAKRADCYKARDAYYECAEKNPSPDKKHPIEACQHLYNEFENQCGAKWTEHFIRKKDYEKFKERLQKEGLDSIDRRKLG